MSRIQAVSAGALAAVLLGAAPLPASEDPLLSRLEAKLERLETLQGRFVQTVDAPGLGKPRSEEGRFWIQRPSRMRWEYEKPEVKLAVADGVSTWLYVPQDKEAYRGAMEPAETGAWSLVIGGRMRLSRDFRARRLSGGDLADAGPQGAAGAVVLELTPLKPVEDFEKLILSIDPERLAIRRLTLLDPLGQRMVFDLFDLEEDRDLPEALFRFEVPPGVEVLEQH